MIIIPFIQYQTKLMPFAHKPILKMSDVMMSDFFYAKIPCSSLASFPR